MMVLGIFLYVGAEISLSSGIPILLSTQFGIDLETWGLLGNSFFFVSIIAGRFAGSVILNYMAARKFFLLTAALSAVGVILLFTPHQSLVLAGILFSGLGFANVFPLIFSITVDTLPERNNEISGLMITAIVGGAVVPPIMGLVADLTSVAFAIIVPFLAILYVAYLAVYAQRLQTKV